MMRIEEKLDHLHSEVKSNKWYRYFAVFTRIVLAAGFIPSGFTKILDERFTSLSSKHPMGNYLEALYHTGYYYPFIGYVQVLAALLLLIPRTATLGAVIYFPIILNICILSLAVGFDGSLVTSPLMVLANLYLLAWDYDKLKLILPFKKDKPTKVEVQLAIQNKFPIKFFSGVFIAMAVTILLVRFSYHKKTRNNYEDCVNDCKDAEDSKACLQFCDCIHHQGKSFNECAEELRRTQHLNHP